MRWTDRWTDWREEHPLTVLVVLMTLLCGWGLYQGYGLLFERVQTGLALLAR